MRSGRRWTPPTAGLAALPKDKIAQLLDETAQSVGGLGPALQRLVDATQAIVGDFKNQITDVNDIIQHSGPVLDSQVNSGSCDRALGAQPEHVGRADRAKRPARARASCLRRRRPPIRSTRSSVTSGIRCHRRWRISRWCSTCSSATTRASSRCWCSCRRVLRSRRRSAAPFPHQAALDLALSINQPPPCLTGFIPASEWRSPADTSLAPLPTGTYCKIPMDTPANSVRGSRNIPCVDVPGKRAATPRECRDRQTVRSGGDQPLVRRPEPDPDLPGARGALRPVGAARHGDPGAVGGQRPEPGTGRQAAAGRVTPPPISDPLQRPGSGSVQCNGQQPNPCVYTPGGPPTAVYSPQSGELVGPDGVKYSVENSTKTGDDGWKEMLAPVAG